MIQDYLTSDDVLRIINTLGLTPRVILLELVGFEPTTFHVMTKPSEKRHTRTLMYYVCICKNNVTVIHLPDYRESRGLVSLYTSRNYGIMNSTYWFCYTTISHNRK